MFIHLVWYSPRITIIPKVSEKVISTKMSMLSKFLVLNINFGKKK